MSDEYLIKRFPGKGLTYREWHLFVHGVGAGVREASCPVEEADDDRWYWSAGYTVGFSIRYGLLIAAALVLKDVKVVSSII